MESVLGLIRSIPKELEERRVVLLLIDGLGTNELRVPKRHFKKIELRTVFPSSTPTFLYSFHSLLPPAEHGFLEWYMRFGEFIVTIPPWDTIEGIPVELLAPIDEQEVFPFKPLSQLLKEKGFSSHYYTPFADSIFTRLTSRGASQTKIAFLSEVFPLRDADFSFIYWHSIDSILHEHYKGEAFSAELRLLEDFIALLWKKLPKKSKLFVLSDHGLTEIKRVYGLPIVDGCCPVGGSRVAFYKDVEPEKVQATFRRRRIPAEVLRLEELEEFGKDFSRRCKENFGDVVAIAKSNVAFRFPFEQKKVIRGAHGGLDKDESYVNVWIAEKI